MFVNDFTSSPIIVFFPNLFQNHPVYKIVPEILLKIEHVDFLHFHILRKLSTFSHNPLQNTYMMKEQGEPRRRGGTKAI
jgi:hypothetical protein